MKIIEKPSINRWLDALGSVKAGDKNSKLWKYVYWLASKPRRTRVSVNLAKIDKYSAVSENVVVPGKVLGVGSVSKSLNIAAIEYSKDSIRKLKEAKCNVVEISDMMKKENVKIII